MVASNPIEEFPSIKHLLPHQGGMILLDELTSCGENIATARVNISRLLNFADITGLVPSFVGLECMVQTLAAMAGWARFQQGLRPLVGLVLGSRRCTFHRTHFNPGAEEASKVIHVRIETVLVEETLGVFDGEVSIHGELIVQGRIKAIQPASEVQLQELVVANS